MQYIPFTAIFEKKSGEQDVLGNEITSEVQSQRSRGQFTEWNANDVAVLGYNTIQGTRKFITPELTREESKTLRKVIVEGDTYTVKSVKDLRKYILLTISKYR